jgi:hypothetical protein
MLNLRIIKGKFEGTIGIIKSRNSMDKQYNAQKEIDKKTKNDRQNNIQTTND